jgi:hypothetical protein
MWITFQLVHVWEGVVCIQTLCVHVCVCVCVCVCDFVVSLIVLNVGSSNAQFIVSNFEIMFSNVWDSHATCERFYN